MRPLVVWLVLGIFSIIILGPILYHIVPPYIFSPDIQFLKGKVLRVMDGDLYSDPVTGFPTFHPPYYYCVLGGIVLMGFDIDHAIFAAIILATLLSVFFMHKLTAIQCGRETAVYSVLLLPLMAEYINNVNLLLASAFYFSMPFFLAGLWLYYREEANYRFTGAYAFLWGVAFTISPGYLFLVGLFFLSEIVLRRRTYHFLFAAGIIIVTMIPFFIHGYFIFSKDMFGTAAFSIWPGWPGFSFWSSLALSIISPGGHKFTEPIIWAGLIATAAGIAALIRIERNRGLIVSAAIAYCLTFIHYQPQYAARIHLYLLILLVPFGVKLLLDLKKRKIFNRAVILCFVALGLYYHYSDLMGVYRGQEEDLPIHRTKIMSGVINQLYTYVRPNDYILVSSENYRFHVLPYVPAHALRAWRTGEYYQLKTEISERLYADYDSLMQCADTVCLNHFCRKYDIRTAFVQGPDERNLFPVFRVVDEYWHSVYSGHYFRIYRKG